MAWLPATTHRAAKTAVLLFLFIFLTTKLDLDLCGRHSTGAPTRLLVAEELITSPSRWTAGCRVYELRWLRKEEEKKRIISVRRTSMCEVELHWTLNIYTTYISWYTRPYHFRVCHKHHTDAQLGKIWCSSIITVIIPFLLFFWLICLRYTFVRVQVKLNRTNKGITNSIVKPVLMVMVAQSFAQSLSGVLYSNVCMMLFFVFNICYMSFQFHKLHCWWFLLLLKPIGAVLDCGEVMKSPFLLTFEPGRVYS